MPQTLRQLEPLHGPFHPHPDWKRVGMTPRGDQLFKERLPQIQKYPDLDMDGEKLVAELRDELSEDLPSQFPDPDAIDFEHGDGIPESYAIRYDMISKRHRVWARHFQTDQKLYPRNDHEVIWIERTFFVESDGMGNQYKHFYNPPTPEQIAAIERDGKIDSFMRELAGMAVDAGMTAEELLAASMAGTAVVPQESASDDDFIAPPGADEDDSAGQARDIDDDPPSNGAAPADDVDYPVHRGFGSWELSNGTVTDQGVKKEEAIKLEEEIQAARSAQAAQPDF